MIKSLYAKLAIALLGLFCLLGVSVFVLTQFASDMYRQEILQRLNRDLAGQIVAQKRLVVEDRISEAGLEEVFEMLMVVNPGIEIYLLDPAGNILAFSAPPGKVKRERIDLAPVKKWFEGQIVYPLFGDDPRNPEGKKVFSAARIPEEGRLLGYLYIILGGEIFDSIAEKLKGSYIVQLSAFWIIASLLFALITGLLLFAYLTRRLRRLAGVMDSSDMARTAERLASILGENRRYGDEIDRLTVAFKRLVDRIQYQMENLKEADTLRRELIANVSHDLRTPLAALQGYVETLFLKNTSLSEQERRQHIEIAVKHCERLNKLVDALFELAKLDSHEAEVADEPFNISELSQDVVQKFNLTAEQRHITIRIDRDPDLPFVKADIALIERVIENLLDNAVRHTPAGGTIRIRFGRHNGDVAVRISDDGCGIPAKDLPHIFDRFYQRSRTRNGQTGHSGLGLAIARRILELHDKSIVVESAAGAGTTFTFFLPVHHPA